MGYIKNVVIAGATGYLGPAVLGAVSKTKHFNVTVLVRASTATTEIPNGVKVVIVDYESPGSLVQALQSQDAVVSTLNHLFLDQQTALVNASIKAGVKYFIPSEYGADTGIPEVRNIPYLQPKGVVQDLLKSSGMSYAFLYTGPFLEWGIQNLFLNLKTSTADIWDGGNTSIGITRMCDIGTAVANILLRPDEAKNKELYIASVVATQNEVLSIVKELRPDLELATRERNTKEALAAAWEAKNAGTSDQLTVTLDMIASCVYGVQVMAGVISDKDNDMLGIMKLSSEQFKHGVAEALK